MESHKLTEADYVDITSKLVGNFQKDEKSRLKKKGSLIGGLFDSKISASDITQITDILRYFQIKAYAQLIPDEVKITDKEVPQRQLVMSNLFDNITALVLNEMLNANGELRPYVTARWIAILDNCYQTGDYTSAFAIYTGINKLNERNISSRSLEKLKSYDEIFLSGSADVSIKQYKEYGQDKKVVLPYNVYKGALILFLEKLKRTEDALKTFLPVEKEREYVKEIFSTNLKLNKSLMILISLDKEISTSKSPDLINERNKLLDEMSASLTPQLDQDDIRLEEGKELRNLISVIAKFEDDFLQFSQLKAELMAQIFRAQEITKSKKKSFDSIDENYNTVFNLLSLTSGVNEILDKVDRFVEDKRRATVDTNIEQLIQRINSIKSQKVKALLPLLDKLRENVRMTNIKQAQIFDDTCTTLIEKLNELKNDNSFEKYHKIIEEALDITRGRIAIVAQDAIENFKETQAQKSIERPMPTKGM